MQSDTHCRKVSNQPATAAICDNPCYINQLSKLRSKMRPKTVLFPMTRPLRRHAAARHDAAALRTLGKHFCFKVLSYFAALSPQGLTPKRHDFAVNGIVKMPEFAESADNILYFND
jgi:hypothetical protein